MNTRASVPLHKHTPREIAQSDEGGDLPRLPDKDNTLVSARDVLGNRAVKWTIRSLIALATLIIIGLLLLATVSPGPTPAPLQLQQLIPAPSGTNAAPIGTWKAGAGSIAGFRVPESFLTQSGTIVGRTSAVTGSLVIGQNGIVSGAFQVDLSKLTIYGKPNASFFEILETDRYPEATFTLTQPIVFASLPSDDHIRAAQATGTLALQGIIHVVTFNIKAEYTGSVLEAIGSTSILASSWGVTPPFGVQHTAMIEFLVVLERAIPRL